MIAIFALPKDVHRRHYAKFNGFSRCALVHDHTNIRPVSLHAVPQRAREAFRGREIYRLGKRYEPDMKVMHALAEANREVVARLKAVLIAAQDVCGSARRADAAHDDLVVSANLLDTMARLADEARAEALRQTTNVERILGAAK
jgi:hypothetical protein